MRLAVDTSTRNLSLALEKEDRLRYRNLAGGRDLARELPGLLDQFLSDHRVSLKQLRAIVIGLGPGSFTGLRVGVASVKALAFSLGLPVFGASSLDAIAYAARALGNRICVVQDARRELFYINTYESDGQHCQKHGPDLLCDVSKALSLIGPKTVVVGDAIPLLKGRLGQKRYMLAPEEFWSPQARFLFPFAGPKAENPAKLVPTYLYPENCQVTVNRT
jgi:tRNA threonylcarbamoyladenosine biosynthesis protein TsaB